MASYDCQSCGACCCNSDENRAEGYPWYVEIEADNALLARPDSRKRYVVLDPDGAPHLRLDPSGRCAALQGRLGQRVSCRVYAQRPRDCRRVQPGDAACLRSRRERGIDAD